MLHLSTYHYEAEAPVEASVFGGNHEGGVK